MAAADADASTGAPPARTLKVVDMDNVTGDAASPGFRLVCRHVLMDRLLELVGDDPRITYKVATPHNSHTPALLG